MAPGRPVLADSALATCTVWIAIDASTTENGCLRVIPGSHHRHQLRSHHRSSRNDVVLDQELDADAFDEAAAWDVELQPGQMSVARRVPDPRLARQLLTAPPRRGWRCATCRPPPTSTAACCSPAPPLHLPGGLLTAADLAGARRGPHRPERFSDRTRPIARGGANQMSELGAGAQLYTVRDYTRTRRELPRRCAGCGPSATGRCRCRRSALSIPSKWQSWPAGMDCRSQRLTSAGTNSRVIWAI